MIYSVIGVVEILSQQKAKTKAKNETTTTIRLIIMIINCCELSNKQTQKATHHQHFLFKHIDRNDAECVKITEQSQFLKRNDHIYDSFVGELVFNDDIHRQTL